MMNSPAARKERIEILSVSLLDQHRQQVETLKALARSLGIGIGWHYLLDWSWILAMLDDVEGKRILDAGAGEGLLQWYLAGHGAQVISVDRTSRAELSLRFRARYAVRGMTKEDLVAPQQVWRKNVGQARGIKAKTSASLRGFAGWIASGLPRGGNGRVILYNRDLADMPSIPDNSVEAVVAVSALEHNSPEGLVKVVNELMRVLKPGGMLLATLGAARDTDWFHEPSQGWCYTEASLRRLFSLPGETISNYSQYDELFATLKNCTELSHNLASFYYQSGNNGMPWGKWDPQYQSVGVVKVKY